MDAADFPPILAKGLELGHQGLDIAKNWLLSPAAWSQFLILIAAYVLAWAISKKIIPRVQHILTPDHGATSIVARGRLFLLMFLPLLLPLLAYAFTGIGETVTRSIFGSGAVIAFGKRVFLFLAIRTFAKDMLRDPMLRLLGKFVLIPVGALYALGLLDLVSARLQATVVPLGNLSFNLLWLLQFLVVGGVIFWLGRWSNE
jgi:potassium efflux system protein